MTPFDLLRQPIGPDRLFDQDEARLPNESPCIERCAHQPDPGSRRPSIQPPRLLPHPELGSLVQQRQEASKKHTVGEN